jgi:hypothetical protein
MRALVVCFVALSLVGGCRSRKRYDGTCKVDSDCLDSQKCSADVCVRKAPLFPAYKPKSVVEPAPTPHKFKKFVPLPGTMGPEVTPVKKPDPQQPRPDLGPAVPRRIDREQSRRFRLDA